MTMIIDDYIIELKAKHISNAAGRFNVKDAKHILAVVCMTFRHSAELFNNYGYHDSADHIMNIANTLYRELEIREDRT